MAQIERTVAPMETIDLNRVAAFVRVVDAQSFTAAAKLLGVPKSSVSRAVSKLEQDLGVTLLRRTTRRLSLTEAGTLYLGHAREALQLLSDARNAVVEADEEPRGTVRLTATADPTGRMLAVPIARFLRQYPHIHVELIITPRHVDLVEEGIDLALRAGKLDDTGLVGKRIDAEPLKLYAAPSYLAERGTPRRLKDLLRHDCVLFRGVRGAARWSLSSPRANESITVRGPVNADDFPLVARFACEGLGIALLPRVLATPGLLAGELEAVLPHYQANNAGALYLVYPASRQLPQRVQLLRDFLFEALRSELAACASHAKVSARPTSGS